jgi:hypothetical protein
MGTNNYLGVNESSMRPIEKTSKFTSQWAIPMVEPQDQPQPKRRRRQFNNIVLLFIIYVFKQARRNMFSRRLKVKYRSMTAKNRHKY